MRYNIILSLILAGCSQEPPIVNVNIDVLPAEVPTDPTTDTGETDTDAETDTDPCDVEIRMEDENGNWSDVIVGAAPSLRVVSTPTWLGLQSGTALNTAIEVTSRSGCGDFELLGVQVIIEGENGWFSFDQNESYIDHMVQIDDLGHSVEDAPSAWSGNLNTPDMAYSVSTTWDAEWGPSDEIGGFTPNVLGADEVTQFQFTINTAGELPTTTEGPLYSGLYLITHRVKWRDLETGTVVHYQDLDQALVVINVF